MRERLRWYKRLRQGTDKGRRYCWASAGQLVRNGLASDFQLPYPEPRNEHEDAMNWVSVNPVVSGRADW